MASDKPKTIEDWVRLWAQAQTPWDAGQSPPVLANLLARNALPEGLALVPGCGSGYDLVSLASDQRHVTGIDLAKDAKERFFAKHPGGVSHVNFVVGDFFERRFDSQFELVWDYTFLCALPQTMRERWAERMAELLVPGGVLATLIFPVFDAPDGYQGPPWPMSVDLVRSLVGGWFDEIEVKRVDRSHADREGKEWMALWRRREHKRASAATDEDAEALERAFAGVKPIDGKSLSKRDRSRRIESAKSIANRQGEESARARLDQLVGGGFRFKVDYPDAYSVSGLREGTHRSHVSSLNDAPIHGDDGLDLHGLRADPAKRAVVKYVRAQHKAGHRYALIVHGKGTHSAGAKGVLREVTIEAITKGGAAQFVLAFATAPRRLGGEGALVLKLKP